MMRWGRKKSSPASSSRPSFISHVSPLSWLSKFKQMRINSESNPGKLKQKVKPNSPSVRSSRYACGNGGRFYDGDIDDGFWKLSFGEESHEGKKSNDIQESVLYNLNDEHVIPCSGRLSAKKHGRKEGTLTFKEKDIVGIGEESKLPKETNVSLEIDKYNREKEFENLRRRFERKAQRVLQEQVMKLEKAVNKAEFASTKSAEKDVLQLESPRTIWTPRRHSFVPSVESKNSSLRSTREGRLFSTQSFEEIDRPSEKTLGFEWQNLKRTEQMKAKTDNQRQPLLVSRDLQRRKQKHSSKVRLYSPRTASKVEICKIKALEDMKKAKLKMKKAKERILDETRGLDSFAVVKYSFDPQQDFRDSMVEMITELQINQPVEMEELLACYLTLNADEYHDLIIKVFRQVWFDMNQDSLGII